MARPGGWLDWVAKTLPTALEQNLRLLNTLVKYLEYIYTLETLKEKTLPFIEHLTQYLQTIKRLDEALKDIYLSYLEV